MQSTAYQTKGRREGVPHLKGTKSMPSFDLMPMPVTAIGPLYKYRQFIPIFSTISTHSSLHNKIPQSTNFLPQKLPQKFLQIFGIFARMRLPVPLCEFLRFANLVNGTGECPANGQSSNNSTKFNIIPSTNPANSYFHDEHGYQVMGEIAKTFMTRTHVQHGGGIVQFCKICLQRTSCCQLDGQAYFS